MFDFSFVVVFLFNIKCFYSVPVTCTSHFDTLFVFILYFVIYFIGLFYMFIVHLSLISHVEGLARGSCAYMEKSEKFLSEYYGIFNAVDDQMTTVKIMF